MTKKNGRNDPCPCGSGKKYKSCCLGSLKADSRFEDSSLTRDLQIALEHHRANRLHLAESSYQKVLLAERNHADALHLLGNVHRQLGNFAAAVDFIHKAINTKPAEAIYHNSLGDALKAHGRLEEAIVAYRQALRIRPDYPEAGNSLGAVLHDQGRMEEAAASYRHALSHKPDFAEARYNLAMVLQAQGRLDEAIAGYRQLLLIRPGFAEAYNNLGAAFQSKGCLDEAAASYREALSIKPDYAEAYCNLGVTLQAQGRPDDATISFRQALSLKPDYPEAHSNLGVVLQAQGRLDEAVVHHRQALSIRPNYAEAYSNLLFAMQFDAELPTEVLLNEHKGFGARFEEPLKARWKPHGNIPQKDRKLRVGYVSPDFRRHAVASFIEPVLANHDKDRIEVFCYYNHLQRDEITASLEGYADRWLMCQGMTDEALASRIRADGIDILVDLAGHTANNRLLAFARKPAPIQITYLGYPGTTGLSAMDYRLTDWHADPEGSDANYTERLLRLPGSLCCYRHPPEIPEVGALPAFKNGYVTFGSFNNYNKVDDFCIELWSILMRQLPESRLLMLTVPEGAARQCLRDRFMAHGVVPERLEFCGTLPANEFRRMMQGADIALDPVSVTGGTTTCDTLWMGVPVVVLAGPRFIRRVGLSFMRTAGLDDFVATTADGYLQVASYLSQNLSLLAELRAGLRTHVAASTLTDEVGFTRNLEAIYRQVWAEWCDRAS